MLSFSRFLSTKTLAMMLEMRKITLVTMVAVVVMVRFLFFTLHFIICYLYTEDAHSIAVQKQTLFTVAKSIYLFFDFLSFTGVVFKSPE